jgi:methylated-DNA-[protein]-cysteine S-methyltransferase
MIVASVETQLGRLGIVEENEQITRLLWAVSPQAPSTPLLAEAVNQLAGYFSGERKTFELPLSPLGGPFQQRVCTAMSAIPFGETRTYGELARELGTSAQPLGNACGANSIPIMIPCHRVLSATGLGGFSGSGGVDTKTRLLKHENAYPLLF